MIVFIWATNHVDSQTDTKYLIGVIAAAILPFFFNAAGRGRVRLQQLRLVAVILWAGFIASSSTFRIG